jgi:hypothetical protein
MSLDNRSADRESHTHAVGLCCKERIKDSIDYLRIKAGTGIMYCDKKMVLLNRFGRYFEDSRPVDDRAHCFNAIHDQVKDDLLQLYSVPKHQAITSSQRSAQLYTVPLSLDAREYQHFLDSVFDIHPGDIWPVFLD